MLYFYAVWDILVILVRGQPFPFPEFTDFKIFPPEEISVVRDMLRGKGNYSLITLINIKILNLLGGVILPLPVFLQSPILTVSLLQVTTKTHMIGILTFFKQKSSYYLSPLATYVKVLLVTSWTSQYKMSINHVSSHSFWIILSLSNKKFQQKKEVLKIRHPRSLLNVWTLDMLRKSWNIKESNIPP